MTAIKINVYKQLDGYNFSLSPSIRDIIKKLFPGSHPANNIFVGYDTKSDFESFNGRLEQYIYPALLDVEKERLKEQVETIEFINSETGKIEKVHLDKEK